MTQEYTPTDEVVKDAACFPKPTRLGEPYPIDPDDYDRWLAAHDTQIRAEALTLTDEEADIAVEALDDIDDEAWYYDDKQQVIRDVLKVVASFRKEQKQ